MNLINIIKEELQNLNKDLNKTSLKSILNSNEAYAILDNSNAGESTWCAGGCAILAFALNILYKYPIYVIYDYDNNQIDHYIVKTPNNTFIDCDGEQQNILQNFKRKEGIKNKNLKIIEYSHKLKNTDIPIDINASNKLAELIKNQTNSVQS
jgi:hypothetical protein